MFEEEGHLDIENLEQRGVGTRRGRAVGQGVRQGVRPCGAVRVRATGATGARTFDATSRPRALTTRNFRSGRPWGQRNSHMPLIMVRLVVLALGSAT